MFNFKSLSIYKLMDLKGLQDIDELQEKLISFAYRPMSPTALSSITVAPINGYESDYPQYLYALQGNNLENEGVAIRVNIAKRKIPKQLLNRELNIKIHQYEKVHKEAPNKKTISQFKIDIAENIAKNIPPTESEIDLFIDFKNELVFAGNSSSNAVENCFSLIRKAMGTFNVIPVTHSKDIYQVLNQAFIQGNFDVENITMSDKVKLTEPLMTKNSVMNNFVDCSLPSLKELVKEGHLDVNQIEVYSAASKGSYTICVPKVGSTSLQIKGIKTSLAEDLDVHFEFMGEIELEKAREEERRFILGHLRQSMLGIESDLKTLFGGYEHEQ